MQQLLRWAFTPANDRNSSAVAEVTHAATHDREMFPIRPVDIEVVLALWNWSQMPAIKQELVTLEKCDPELRKKLHIVTSWGPLPVYPAVVSSKLPGKFIFFCSIFKIPPDWMFKQGTINHDCSKKLGR